MIPSIFSNKQSTTMNSNSSTGSLPWDVHRKRKTITDGADNEATAIKVRGKKKNPRWTDQEDSIITDAVINSLEKPFTRWCDLSQKLPNRDGKRIRDRWVNQLDPNINRLPFSREDDLLLWEGQKKFGTKWAEISRSKSFFNYTRSPNQINTRWYSPPFKKFISNSFGPDAYSGCKASKGKDELGVANIEAEPNINRLPFNCEEDLCLWEGYKKFGNKWFEISTKTFHSTRSEIQIKRRWYSAPFKKFISNSFGPDAYSGKGVCVSTICVVNVYPYIPVVI